MRVCYSSSPVRSSQLVGLFLESCFNENISHSFQSSFVRDNIKVLVNKIRFAAKYLLLFCHDDFCSRVLGMNDLVI